MAHGAGTVIAAGVPAAITPGALIGGVGGAAASTYFNAFAISRAPSVATLQKSACAVLETGKKLRPMMRPESPGISTTNGRPWLQFAMTDVPAAASPVL